ncbi:MULTISPECIES: hypothetical protein [unclassified Moorena]|uniref:hypothetical protein n=1 Tax=unclassified Moorena TaxID=2683338 RepID=UPI0025FD506C|nr:MULTISPECIES: hypothetical protein [unclassified Moorena]
MFLKKQKSHERELATLARDCSPGWAWSVSGFIPLLKVATQLEINLAKVSRASLNVPQRYGLESLSRSYRKRCEEARPKANLIRHWKARQARFQAA